MNVITDFLAVYPHSDLALLALSVVSLLAALALWRQWAQERARNQSTQMNWLQEQEALQASHGRLDQSLALARDDLHAAAVMRARHEEAQRQLEQRLQRLLMERQTLQDRFSAEQTRRLEAEKNLELVRRGAETDQHHWGEKVKLLENSEQRLQEQFENLANRIFEQKQETFSRTSQESMQALMQPMREQLRDFRQRVDQVYEKDTDDRRALRHELSHLKDLNEQMNTEAKALTKALKGEKKTQGNWGEMLLERILEESGLRKGHEYDTQVSVKDEAGKRQLPDAIIHLPDNKDIIVDAKVSLVDFERYVNEDGELEKAAYLKAHLKAVRNQMDGLARKNYEQISELQTLDFVLMFIPIEAAFLVAMEHDSLLFRDAFDRNIILVSPSTLLVVLKTIHNIWRNEQQNRNALTIAEEAGKLYDQFALFVESLQDVQKHLTKTQDSLSLSVRRLSDGRGNAMGRVEKLRELGAKAKKRLPVDAQDL